ncbi:hypothetical protein KVR01_010177 [Diaporthe batatas]|uniref:uncharacterized protein n=1 Tax=Diaporthe batatas TaxID=748121 RepID=UPI001D0513B3|nr:uncharacterized protein KVR01_010177 [Diaporthe batatas]KAG8159540.1 hypothetical protein KVR01_010177 [Diaporthe batatas]
MSTGWAANRPGADEPDVNKGPSLTAVSVTLTLIAFLIVALRVWCRLRDWVIIGTMALSLAGMGITLGQVANGAGRHAAYLEPATIHMGLKLNYIGQVVFLWAPCMVKVSIGLFLLRVTPDLIHRKIIYGAMSFILAWTLACFVTLLLQCENIRVIWDDSVHTACWSVEVIHALGWASAAIIKTVYIENYSSTTDNLWNATELTIWTTVELNVGIIAASLPCLRPFFRSLSNGSTGIATAKEYPMHPYSKTLETDHFNHRHTRSQTTTRISSGGPQLEDYCASQERFVSPELRRDSGIRKVTEYSSPSGATSGCHMTGPSCMSSGYLLNGGQEHGRAGLRVVGGIATTRKMPVLVPENSSWAGPSEKEKCGSSRDVECDVEVEGWSAMVS